MSLTEEERKHIEQDIESARKRVSEKEQAVKLEEAKKAGKYEAEQEQKSKQEIERLNKEREETSTRAKELEAKLKSQEDDYKKKMDELIESQAVVKNKNPFADDGSGESASKKIQNLSDDEVNEIELNSRQAFEDHLRRKQ